MSCGFRINENLHIGATIRKTKDKTTVPYHNIPFQGAKISSYSNSGFTLVHQNFPSVNDNALHLDFGQIPLLDITLENGKIWDELIFVEMLVGAQKSGSMVQLVKTDSDEYREYLKDLEEKNSKQIFKLKDLNPGDKVISAICEEGTEMIYLGRFMQTEILNGNDDKISYYSRSDDRKRVLYVNQKKTKRAYFLTHDGKKYTLHEFPISHKAMKEFYKTDDTVERFKDLKHNGWFLSKEHCDIHYSKNRKDHKNKPFMSYFNDYFIKELANYEKELEMESYTDSVLIFHNNSKFDYGKFVDDNNLNSLNAPVEFNYVMSRYDGGRKSPLGW